MSDSEDYDDDFATRTFGENNAPPIIEYHKVVDTSFWQPRDEDEELRLTGSHFAAREVFGGNVQPEVARYVSFEKGIDCLHICCGAGAFIIDMAHEYPNSRFVGVEMDGVQEIRCRLPNVSFMQGNVVDGLNFFPDGSFDYVQMRLFGGILKNSEWPIALKEVYRLLRPGGCVGFMEYEARDTGSQECSKVFRAIRSMMASFGQDPFAGQHLPQRIVEAGFEHIAQEDIGIECGPDTGRAKRWRWIWTQTCLFMGPTLSKRLRVKLENWPAYVDKHVQDLKQSNGEVTMIRCLGRKPLNSSLK